MKNVRFFTYVVLLAVLTLGGCVGRTKHSLVIQGDLTGRHTWSGTVRIRGDVILEESGVLTIEPGTKILFLPAGENDRFREHPNFVGSELIIHGQLIAEGTAERPIVFRSHRLDAPPGSWGGINLSASEDSSFAYTVFRQADSAVHSQNSRVYIEQSIFEDNLVAIRFHSSEILIENNLIHRNGTGIRFHFGSPVICKNDILQNGKGFFITSYPRDYLIKNNSIRQNERSVILGEEVPDDVIMRHNDWGTNDPEQVRSGFFDAGIVPYLGRVLIEPLHVEPDPASGVQWKR